MATIRALAALFLFTCAATASAATFTVTNAADSGPGSLRQAMLDANADTSGLDTIEFAIGSGPQTIQPLSSLPALTGWVMIDATTQPGYAGKPLIEIDGSLEGGGAAGGLHFDEGGIRALVINNFAGTAVTMNGPSSVRGCYIGTDVTGLQARLNGAAIVIGNNAANPTPSRIGGAGPNEGNLIRVKTTGVTLSDNGYVDGNDFIAEWETTSLVVKSNDVEVSSIGEHSPNYFAGGKTGIRLQQAGNVHILNNRVGFKRSGEQAPTQAPSISVESSVDTVVTGNDIASQHYGVAVSGTSLRAIIRQNSIRGVYGISLGAGDNDAGDVDTGPNNRLNHPDLTTVTSGDGTTTIAGSYSGAPNRTLTIDFYRGGGCSPYSYDSSSSSEAWLGAIDITTDASGHASFTHAVNKTIASAQSVVASATYALEGTSEFSHCASVEGAGILSMLGSDVTIVEGASVTFTVQRSSGTVGTISVTFVVGGASEAPGRTCTPATGTVTFADGEAAKSFQVTFVDDSVYEERESYNVYLKNPTGGAILTPYTDECMYCYDDGINRRVSLWTSDPPLFVERDPLTVAEGDSGPSSVSIALQFTTALPMPVTVHYATYADPWSPKRATSGVDYEEMHGTWDLAAGETLQKTVTITIRGDTLYEDVEIFYLQVYFIGSYGNRVGDNLEIRIANDDGPPRISVKPVSIVETDRTYTADVPITSTSDYTGTVYVSITPKTAELNSDFKVVSTSVSFSGQKTQKLPVQIVGDRQTEPDETIVVTIDQVTGDGSIGTKSAQIAILDDDTGVGPPDQAVPLGGGGPIVIDIGVPLTKAVTISMASSNPQMVSVPEETVLEAGQSSMIVDAKALQAPGAATVTITMPPELDGDVFSVRVRTYTPANVVFDPGSLSLFESQTATVQVTMEPAPDEPLTLALSAAETVVVPKTITIPGSFTVEAKKAGPIFITLRLPRPYGDRDVLLLGHVRETPAAPTILKISPPDGPSAGGTIVELEGTNFVRDCALTFGGAAATGVQYVTATFMTAITPVHEPGTVDLVLTCGQQSSTFMRGFTFTDAAPQLSQVAPSTGSTGGGTQVRITGTNLRSSCWPFFDGIAATDASLESPAAMLAVTPAHGAGAVGVLLRCTGGEASLADAFFYTAGEEPGASIMTIAPAAAAPGEEVTLTGTRFRPSDRVAFTTTPATILRTAPDKHVVLVPELEAGRYSIDLTDTIGRATTTGPIFTALEATPRIRTVVPQSAPAGAEIELQGEGFRPSYTFSIAGKPAPTVSSASTRAIVRMDAGIAPGSYDVSVINPAGNVASIGPKIEITAGGLAITAITPRCATTSGGGTITITGTGFDGALLVTVGTAMATDVTIVNESTITATIPAGEAGPAQIRIAAGDGRSATWTSGFRYVSPFDPLGCNGVVTTKDRSVRH